MLSDWHETIEISVSVVDRFLAKALQGTSVVHLFTFELLACRVT